jgi:hypothetical protein
VNHFLWILHFLDFCLCLHVINLFLFKNFSNLMILVQKLCDLNYSIPSVFKLLSLLFFVLRLTTVLFKIIIPIYKIIVMFQKINIDDNLNTEYFLNQKVLSACRLLIVWCILFFHSRRLVACLVSTAHLCDKIALLDFMQRGNGVSQRRG